MAIARIGRYSDVYVVADVVTGGFRCVCCRLQPSEPCLFGGELHMDWECKAPKQLLVHLNQHYYDGPHKVPKAAFDRVVEMWDATLAEKEAL